MKGLARVSTLNFGDVDSVVEEVADARARDSVSICALEHICTSFEISLCRLLFSVASAAGWSSDSGNFKILFGMLDKPD